MDSLPKAVVSPQWKAASTNGMEPKLDPNLVDLNKLPMEILDHGDDDILVMYSGSSSSSSRNNKNPSGTNPDNAISVEDYHCSNPKNLHKGKALINLSDYPDHDDDVQVLLTPPPKSFFMCDICAEERPRKQLFGIMGCTHSYCSKCIAYYISSRLGDNIVQIGCPVSGCIGRLEPYHCRTILPPDVFDRWGLSLCESIIPDSHKFYCPFKDCSALLLLDDTPPTPALKGSPSKSQSKAQATAASRSTKTKTTTTLITESECPYCRRLFCAQCKVPWHVGIECQEYQKLGKDERDREDIMLVQLAKKNKWTRCTKCKFYVEKSAGCLFMKCRCIGGRFCLYQYAANAELIHVYIFFSRCGHTFCYNCGTSPLIDHYCSTCKR